MSYDFSKLVLNKAGKILTRNHGLIVPIVKGEPVPPGPGPGPEPEEPCEFENNPIEFTVGYNDTWDELYFNYTVEHDTEEPATVFINGSPIQYDTSSHGYAIPAKEYHTGLASTFNITIECIHGNKYSAELTYTLPIIEDYFTFNNVYASVNEDNDNQLDVSWDLEYPYWTDEYINKEKPLDVLINGDVYKSVEYTTGGTSIDISKLPNGDYELTLRLNLIDDVYIDSDYASFTIDRCELENIEITSFSAEPDEDGHVTVSWKLSKPITEEELSKLSNAYVENTTSNETKYIDPNWGSVSFAHEELVSGEDNYFTIHLECSHEVVLENTDAFCFVACEFSKLTEADIECNGMYIKYTDEDFVRIDFDLPVYIANDEPVNVIVNVNGAEHDAQWEGSGGDHYIDIPGDELNYGETNYFTVTFECTHDVSFEKYIEVYVPSNEESDE